MAPAWIAAPVLMAAMAAAAMDVKNASHNVSTVSGNRSENSLSNGQLDFNSSSVLGSSVAGDISASNSSVANLNSSKVTVNSSVQSRSNANPVGAGQSADNSSARSGSGGVPRGAFLATRLYDASGGDLCAACCSSGQGCAQLQPGYCCGLFPACSTNSCAAPAASAAPPTSFSESSGSGVAGVALVTVLVVLCVCVALACCCMREMCGCLCPCMTDNPYMYGDGYGAGSMAGAALAGGLAGYEMGQMTDGYGGGYGGYGGW